MADLNALIAQGAQFQAPVDPFAQYGKMQQLQQGLQANQLNQMKMEEMQAATAERNALRQLNPASPDYESQLFKVNPTMGIAYRKEAATAAAQQATQQAQKAQALKTNLDNHRSFLVGVNDQPSYDAWRTLTAQNIPELANILPAKFSTEVKDSLLKKADDVSKQLTTPTPISNLAKLQKELAALPPNDPMRQTYIDAIAKESQFAPHAPPAESPLAKLQREMAALPADDPRRAAYDAAIAKESQFAPHAPPAESSLAKLQREMAALPPGDSRIPQYVAMINKEITRAPGTVVNIDQKQQGSFAAGLGTGQSKRILESQAGAQDAADILATNEVGRSLLKSGAITGAGADFFVGLNKALKQGGIDFGYADAAANSQAYGAAMAANTGKLIKQFGAGTAISDADREYATKAAAGQITMDEAAIRKVLDINDRAARNVIQRHNKLVKGVQTNLPLEVEIPTAAPPPPPSGASLIPGSTPAAAGGGATVTLPDGRIKTFPNAAAADQFKKAAGL